MCTVMRGDSSGSMFVFLEREGVHECEECERGGERSGGGGGGKDASLMLVAAVCKGEKGEGRDQDKK